MSPRISSNTLAVLRLTQPYKITVIENTDYNLNIIMGSNADNLFYYMGY